MTTTAKFEQIERPDNLWARNNASWYRITPGKGARIEGIVSVGITSREQTNYSGERPVKVDCPAMWVELSPAIADDRGGCSSERLPITINGVQRDERFGAEVELLPASREDGHRDSYLRRVIEAIAEEYMTVNGVSYFVTSRLNYTTLSDSARKLVRSVIEAIAAEYITDERWHAYRVSQAEYAVDRAAQELDKAQAALDSAVAARTAVKAERA
jgi:hypothetical protein